MKPLLLLIASIPAFASFQISSAVLQADGLTVTVTMNGTYTSGVTTSCFTVTGGTTAANAGTPSVSATGGSATITLTFPVPLYGEQSPVVNLAANPTCLMVGSTGTTVSSSATMTTGTAANLSEWHAAGTTPLSASSRYDGGPLLGNDVWGAGYANSANWKTQMGGIRTTVSGATEVRIWAFNNFNAWCIRQDGADIGTRVVTGASGVYSEITLATGLSGTHVYREFECTQTNSTNPVIAAVRFVGGTLGAQPAASNTVFAYGDSIIGGQASGPADSRTSDWAIMMDTGSAALGMQTYTASGEQVSGVGGLATTGEIAKITPSGTPTGTVIAIATGGVNDQRASINTTTFETDMVTMIQRLATATGGTVLVRGILPNLSTNSANWANYVAKQASATVTAGGGACMYHTGSLSSGAPDWINPTTTQAGCNTASFPPVPTQDTLDQLHPCAATTMTQLGYGKIANREAPIIAGKVFGSSFSVTGPATVALTRPASFTATLASGATWMDPVTVTSSVGSDVICIVGGACGYGSVTTPVSLATTTFTFKVQPMTSGARTISYTGLADCWTAPTSATLTATATTASFGATQ